METTTGNPFAVRSRLTPSGGISTSTPLERLIESGRRVRLAGDSKRTPAISSSGWRCSATVPTSTPSKPSAASIGAAFTRGLDQAEQQGLLVDDGRTCRFVDPLDQRTVVASSSGPALHDRHRFVADRLEEHYGDGADRHALVLLHHLRRAGGHGRAVGDAPLRRAGRRPGDGGRSLARRAGAYDVALGAIGDVTETEIEPVELTRRTAWAHYHDYDMDRAITLFRRSSRSSSASTTSPVRTSNRGAMRCTA